MPNIKTSDGRRPAMNVALVKRSRTLRFDVAGCLFILLRSFHGGHALQPPNRGPPRDLPRPAGFQLRGQRSSRIPSRSVLSRSPQVIGYRDQSRRRDAFTLSPAAILKWVTNCSSTTVWKWKAAARKSWKETLGAIAGPAAAAGQCWSRWNSDFVARIVSFGGLSGSS